MSDYKIILGYLAVLIGIIGYIIYFRQIFLGKIKPHAFSWFTWGLITSIAFTAQLFKQGGPGSWITGVTALACFIICALALAKGSRNFTKLDWFFFVTALLAILLWWLAKDPTYSVILVTLADAIGGTLPTLRKSYYKPYEEGATLFALSSIKWIPALFALESLSLATWLYPASLILTNALIVFIILIRRVSIRQS